MSPACFHCGLPVPAGSEFNVAFEGERRPMCCRGCQAVAETIVSSGLGDYYRHRTAMPQSGQAVLPPELDSLKLYDREDVQQSFVTRDDDAREASLILENISCAACLWLNERHLQQLPGIVSAHVNYATQRARVRWDDSRIHLSDILFEIQKLGYNAHPFSAAAREESRRQERRADFRRIAVAGICAAQLMMLAVGLYAGAAYGIEPATRQLLRWVSALLAVPVMTYAAWPFYRSAWYALRNWHVNMDVPVVLAIVIAFAGSIFNTMRDLGTVYFDTLSMFVLFLLTTRYFERAAREKSVQASENLLQLTPAVATRIEAGKIETVAAAALRNDDVVMVAAGATVPADGIIITGASEFDESIVTGESRPVAHAAGDTVIAGSVNISSPVHLRVSAVGEATVLAGVVRLLDRAQAERPVTVELADRVAAWFVAGLLVFAGLVTLAWLIFAPERSFEILLAVLVVTCPCALALAAPAAYAAAGSVLLARGALLTRGRALEKLAEVDHVMLDKTGTLTEGQPALTRVDAIGIGREHALGIAAVLEKNVRHPFARALLHEARGTTLPQAQNVSYVPGQGVRGTLQDGEYFLGRGAGLDVGRSGVSSVIGLYRNGTLVARFHFSDALRADARELIEQLRNAGLDVSIASGDHRAAVEHVAATLGVRAAHAELSPAQKLELLRKLQASGKTVLMVGDGINDAAILAGADVSVAVGNATDVARAASDIVLLSRRLLMITEMIATARRTRAIVRQNFIWAILYNAVMLPLAALGFVAPWLAALGMSASSFIVVMNALRLRDEAA